MKDRNEKPERRSVKNRIRDQLEKIKNVKVLRRLPVYEIEKAEKRYESMAEDGWFLYRHGDQLEYYRKGEPKKLQYRIEYCPVKAFDGVQELSEDQVEFYEDCGWNLVSERRGIYVFSAPAESGPMELYSDPKEQIRMLKSVHHYIGNFAMVFICCYAGTILGKALSGQQSLLSWEAFHCIDGIWLLVAFWLLYVIWEDCYAAYRSHLLIRRVKRGKPIHHLPEEKIAKHRIAKAVKAVLLTLVGVLAACSAVMLLRVTETPLSEVGEERLYLLAGEVYEGERSGMDIFGREAENSVTWAPALTADYYEVSEYLTSGESDFVSMDQKVYVLKNIGGDMEKRARRLADSLLKGSVFYNDDYDGDGKVIEHPAFDYVVTAQYTLVAVKDNRVIRVTCIASGTKGENWDRVLEVLAEKWE